MLEREPVASWLTRTLFANRLVDDVAYVLVERLEQRGREREFEQIAPRVHAADVLPIVDMTFVLAFLERLGVG